MGLILHLTESEKLKIKNNNLYLINGENDVFVDINDFDAIVIDTTKISITTSAILYAVEHKVPIIICNNKHIPQAFCFDIYMHYKTSERIRQQIEWDNDKKERLWREIIKEKINGQRNNILNLDKDSKTYMSLTTYMEMIDNNSDDACIQEAISARLYFKEMFGKDFVRQNEDITNYALNYGYSLLRSYICCLITAKGLHPSLGLSHHNIYNNYNFADDIIEIFRRVVDFIVHEQLKYYDEFSKEFRVQLLEILSQEVFYKGKEVSIKRAINMFLDNIISYFQEGTELELPKLEVEFASA